MKALFELAVTRTMLDLGSLPRELQCKYFRPLYENDNLIEPFSPQFSANNLAYDSDHGDELQRMQIMALMDMAQRQDLPWDFFINYQKRNSGGLGEGLSPELAAALATALGYDDLLGQPRLLDRETRDDGRRYLMWRKITG